MSRKRIKKRPPKRTLALPDLEQSKAAVLTLLHQRAGSAAMIEPSRISLIGTAQNLGSHLTARWFCGTGSIWNRSSTLPRQSISVWLQFVASPMKRPIPVSSARSWLPEFDE
jgi:hypothetical protein